MPSPLSLPLSSLEERTEGLVCLSGCARDGALAGIFERAGGHARPAPTQPRPSALGERLVRAFGRDGFRVELQRPLWRRDLARNRWLSGLAERLGVPCVATGNVHAHDPSRAALQDALVAIRLGASLDETGALRRGNWRSVLSTAGRDGAPLRRASRRGGGVGAPGRAAPLQPHLTTTATATPAPRTRRPTASWRSSARRGSRGATPARPSDARRSGASKRSCG